MTRRGRGPVGRTRTSYDTYAARYDAEVDLYDRLMLGDGRLWACRHAQGDVLEVAVGTGRNLAYYRPEARICGLDVSSGMLDVARDRAQSSRVSLVQGDAQRLPLRAACFDTVVCTLGLSSVPDDATALDEMNRVLRPGGRLVLLGHVASRYPAVRSAQRLIEWLSRQAGRPNDHQRRQVTPRVLESGFEITYRSASRRGVVERLIARKPLHG